MKKIKKPISILFAIMMLLSITSGFSCSVLADTSGDFEYTVLDDGTAEITGYTGNATDLVIPSEIDGYTVVSIGYLAFWNCEQLKCVTIPIGVIEIGNNAFLGCRSLTSVTLPNGITQIKYSAFGECVNLENIIIPDSVTRISQWAFEGCESLTNIIIPSSVEWLGSEAFIDCTSLEYAVILNKDCKIYDSFVCSNGEERYNLTDFTIYGYKNSTAQMYAEEKGYSFINIDEPIITDGTVTEYTIGSGTGAMIHCTYELANFINVAVDGNIVDEDSYTLAQGSTILTFNSDYLDTLEPGEHNVALNYTNGTVSTTLTIIGGTVADEPATDSPEEPTSSTGNPTTDAPKTDTAANGDPENIKQESPSQNSASETSPSTGAPRAVLALAAVLAAGSAIIILRKKEKQ